MNETVLKNCLKGWTSPFPDNRKNSSRLYEEFKVRINGLVIKYGRVPFNGLKMKDGTPWPGNNTNNHPGMIQILFGRGGVYDNDCEKFPRLVYISREKRPDFKHNKNAGSMNALVRVSALLTNGAYILNLDCNQYINNSRALIEAMCFMMDPITLKKVCYIQFPHRFDGIDANDRYVNHNTVFYNMNLKGLDGIQGPLCFGTGCIFSRKALYGYDPPSKLKHYRKNRWGSQIKSSNDTHSYYSSTLVLDEDSSSLLVMERGYLETEFPSVSLSLEMCFGQSPIFLASILVGDDRFSQSTTHEEILREAIQVISCDYEENTGWGREVIRITTYSTLKYDFLNKKDLKVLLSKRATTRILFLTIICFIYLQITSEASIWLILLLLSVFANIVLEIRWNEVGIENWWRNRQFWVTAGISSHLFAVLQGSCGAVLRLFICSRSRTKSCAEGSEVKISKVRWTSLLILPITITLVNLIAMAVGISYALGGAYASWTLQFIKLLFTFLVIIHLYPFLKGVTSQRHQIPTILVVWSLLLAFLFSLLWINVNPFTTHFHGPSKKDCGIQC
ncbi:hypothetical protein GIB67_029326 [Kingdonia uniflora]|uniref:Cellulose synthase n=1 Tax=Kingdonia uniflora TaxID=39325 RepID=A0A7J7N8K7_9MAGN|nr:hypothetical protein GIB67_029326 [Kingdonia uniflora]